MSDYNTSKDVEKIMIVLNKTDYASVRTLKKNVTIFNESVVSLIFYALQRAEQQGIGTDHSISVKDTRTLDIGQVQNLINTHCKVSHSRDDIVEALQSLAEPRAIDIVETCFTSEIDQRTFYGIRLQYTDTPISANKLTNTNNYDDVKSELLAQVTTKPVEKIETDNLAKELSQVDLTMPKQSETNSEQSWKANTLKLYEQQTIDRDMIQSLRAIIIDMAETLHVADPNARISMTSSDLLDLINSQNDISDNAF